MYLRKLVLIFCGSLGVFGEETYSEDLPPSSDFSHQSINLTLPSNVGANDLAWFLTDTHVYAIGGNQNDGTISRTVWWKPIHSEKWLEEPEPLPPSLVVDGSTLVARFEEQLILISAAAKPSATVGSIVLGTDGSPQTLRLLPSLPVGFDPTAATVLEDKLWVSALATEGEVPGTSVLLSLRLVGNSSAWSDPMQLPWVGSKVQTITAQRQGVHNRLYMTGSSIASSSEELLSYDPYTKGWRVLEAPHFTASTRFVAPMGIVHLFALGETGLRGTGPQLNIYNTNTDRWITGIELPALGVPLAASVDELDFSAIIRTVDGTTQLVRSKYIPPEKSLHVIDYLVVALFFAGLVFVSLFHSRTQSTAEGYFRGSKRIPWLAAGMSIVATRLSSTSFVSIPAKSFSSNLHYALVPVTNLVGAFLMTRYFVGFFTRLNVTSGYEYLEKRFNGSVRTIGSLNYLAYELARIGLLILVPAVALAGVTKFDLHLAILAMGLIATTYTVLGGIEGVIWADVFQISVKIGGLLLAALLVFASLDGNPIEWVATAKASGHLDLVDFSWDFTRDTIWVFILFWFTDGLKSYVANQTIIQRFISTRDERTAKRTIWSSAIIGTAVSLLLLFIGVGLFLFYHQFPDRLNLTMNKPDAVFPWFIVYELPVGAVGILLSALIAAAMSSLDGALNSTTTVLVTDFYRRFQSGANDKGAVILGKWLTGAIGLCATGVALTMADMATKSLFDQTLRIIGLFGGGLGGLFLLGMLTTRTSAVAALIGFGVSAMVQYFVSQHTSMNLLTYMFTGMSSCMAVGFLAALIVPERKDLTGLTVHTTPLGNPRSE